MDWRQAELSSSVTHSLAHRSVLSTKLLAVKSTSSCVNWKCKNYENPNQKWRKFRSHVFRFFYFFADMAPLFLYKPILFNCHTDKAFSVSLFSPPVGCGKKDLFYFILFYFESEGGNPLLKGREYNSTSERHKHVCIFLALFYIKSCPHVCKIFFPLFNTPKVGHTINCGCVRASYLM